MRAAAAAAALPAAPLAAAVGRPAACRARPGSLPPLARPPALRPARRVAAASSSRDEPSPQQPAAGDLPILEVERQNERSLAFGAQAGLLGAAGLAFSLVPQRAVEFLWGASPAVLVAGIARNLGGMLLLAAVCAHCLKEAAEHGRMQSETYLRLNLALMWWSVGTAAALWLAPAQPLRAAQGLMTALLLATAWHSALTFQETDPRGLNPFYLLKQFLRSLGNLGSYSNTESSVIVSVWSYGMAAKAAMAAAAAHLLEAKMRLMSDGLVLAPLGQLGSSLLPLTGIGYLLASVVLFTQKDAAKRGRLGASTFRALNAGLAIAALVNATSMAAWWQAGVLAHTKLAVLKIGMHALLGGLALYNLAFAKKKK